MKKEAAKSEETSSPAKSEEVDNSEDSPSEEHDKTIRKRKSASCE